LGQLIVPNSGKPEFGWGEVMEPVATINLVRRPPA
jgi:hypothetical protein